MMSQLRSKILSSICLLFFSVFLFAQESKNPFDLIHRKAKAGALTNALSVDSTQAVIPPSTSSAKPTPSFNPFDIQRGEAMSATTEAAPTEEVLQRVSPPPAKVLPKISGNFKFWTITLLLVLLTLAVTLYNSNISKVYRAFLNDNFLKMVHREHGTVVAFPYLLLYTLFFISGGIFIFLIGHHYDLSLSASHFWDLLLCIGIFTAIFLLKHLVLNIIGAVFPVQKEIKQYSFTIIIFGIVLGLLLIPANVLIAFVPTNLTQMFIYGTFIVIGFLYLFRILRGLFIASRYITLHKFHFFMYLCTVEIAPLLVLIKAILLKIG
ncbi:MAG: DUF4271 domain-containing protein [Bacteroidota bacterium]